MKYATGDYLSGKDFIFMEIMGAIDAPNPVYACYSVKAKEIHWQTEKALDKFGFSKATPDFKRYEDIKIGDIIRIRHENEAGESWHSMLKVLVRTGDMVLLSHDPIRKQDAEQENDLRQQLDNLLEEVGEHLEEVKPHVVRIKKSLSKHPLHQLSDEMISGRNAQDVAGEWFHVRELALMNWERLTTDE